MSLASESTSLTPLTETERPAIETLLRTYIATSMFPLSNLRRHGMSGGHPRALRFWARWQAGQITDLLSVSEEGVVFPQCPTGPWGDVRAVLAGMGVKGMLGEGEQIAALRAALGLIGTPGIDAEEPLYRLPLGELAMPDCTGFTLRPLSEAPLAVIIGWRATYLEEVLPMPGENPAEQAARDIAGYLKRDSHRVLLQGDTPVAMTGFNAMLPEAVQIGGVYTPPALRSKGLARRAVALHLAEAQDNGVETAILFAASPQACKAYEAIGFQQTGRYTICMFETPQVVMG